MKRYVLLLLLLIPGRAVCVPSINPENFFFVPEKNIYAHEISWCIADLKFDGSNIKICEFGEGRCSRFGRYDNLYGTGAMWEQVWLLLSTFKVPVWFVANRYYAKNIRGTSKETFDDLGCKHAPTMHHLFNAKKLVNTPCKNIKDLAGLVLLDNILWPQSQYKELCAQRPDLLVLGEATSAFVRTKGETNRLFKETGMEAYKPLFRQYSKEYTPDKATKIINDLAPATTFVIKPLNAAYGNGVIIVEKQNLDQTLSLIFGAQRDKLMSEIKDPSYTHWIKDINKQHIVEAFVQSKSIEIRGKPYDATMRVSFALFNDGGSMGIYFFDAFWKMPFKALTDDGTLNEKHKSYTGFVGDDDDVVFSAPVDPADFVVVKRELSNCLPKLYLRMLEKRGLLLAV